MVIIIGTVQFCKLQLSNVSTGFPGLVRTEIFGGKEAKQYIQLISITKHEKLYCIKNNLYTN